MDTALILPALTTAVTIGLGCGACCSPVISVFLSSYVISHGDGVKTGVGSFASFFLGKILSVVSLCTIAAVISRQFIGADGFVGAFNLRLAAQLIMSGIGLVMALRWVVRQRGRKTDCHGCHDCGKKPVKGGLWPTFLAGITYGFTPCAPLLMMLGYTFTLPVALAGVTGGAFALASAASPVLLLSVLSGALSKKMAREIPRSLRWFQLASYLLLMVMPFLAPI